MAKRRKLRRKGPTLTEARKLFRCVGSKVIKVEVRYNKPMVDIQCKCGSFSSHNWYIASNPSHCKGLQCHSCNLTDKTLARGENHPNWTPEIDPGHNLIDVPRRLHPRDPVRLR